MIESVKILLAIVAILVLWSLWGYFSSSVEQAEYTVVQKADDYEIRQYAPHIEAQTTIDGSRADALNKGFTILAGYIFGGNTAQESVAMTAPVREREGASEKIAMTAPVIAGSEGASRIISFVMPKTYTLQTLPTPDDSRIVLVEVPAKKMAALRFSWFRNTDRIEKMEAKLLAHLSRDGVEVIGKPSYAGYNAPWTPPWMTRNEILVEVR